MDDNIVLVVHGGAGSIKPEYHNDAREGVLGAIEVGWSILESGGSALDAVQVAVKYMEDYYYFNAGRGSVMTEDGTIEMDAMIVDGTTKRIGGVLGVSRIKNPIDLSRLVMDKSFHVVFAGEGAERFGEENGMELIDPEELVTDRVRERLERYLEEKKNYGDYIKPNQDPERRDKYGTVGAVAIDSDGRLASATSTGGVLGKKVGRVGDTPLFGCGTYADDEIAVSATGVGEFIIRGNLALDIKMELRDSSTSEEASLKSLQKMKDQFDGSAGVIVVTRDKGWNASKNTKDLIYAVRTKDMTRDFTQDFE